MALSKHDKSEVLDGMQAISELTSLSFERLRRTGISTWGAAIFDNMISNEECGTPVVSLYDRNKEESELQQYVGELFFNQRRDFIKSHCCRC
jgi:hypothetical protein